MFLDQLGIFLYLKEAAYFGQNRNRKRLLGYQSPLILTELFQHDLINVSYLTACYLYQVMMTLHFLNDIAYDAESTQTSKIRHDS